MTAPGSATPHIRGFDKNGLPTHLSSFAPVGPPLQFAVPALPPLAVGEEYPDGVAFCLPPPPCCTAPCGPIPPTTNPTGGIPPYHFQLGSGSGFPPCCIIIDKDGRPKGKIANSTKPGNYTFIVCAVDLAADSVCGTAVITVVAAGANPFQGSISGSWSGTCEGFPVSGGFSMTINAVGQVSGSYSGSESGSISGTVDASGNMSGSGSAGANSWTGHFTKSGTSLSGSGSWSGGAGCGGPWSGSGTASG